MKSVAVSTTESNDIEARVPCAAARIIIFGCGYVGRALADALAAAGHEVWILSRNADSLAAVTGVPERQRVQADLHTTGWHDRLPGDWDCVFNLVSSAGNGLAGYQTSYIDGNQSIITWAGARTVRRFIYTSATSVYPQCDGEWVTEADVPPLEQCSPSGQLLLQAEQLLQQSSAFATAPIILRLAGIYGPGRHLYLNQLRAHASAIPGDGNAWLNLIHLDDIVDVLCRCLTAPPALNGKILNLCDDAPARKQEIVDWLAGQLGQPSIPFSADLQTARSQRRHVHGRLPNRRIANQRIRQLLNWQPRHPDFRSGYRAILATSLNVQIAINLLTGK